jgi:hypothetical protein
MGKTLKKIIGIAAIIGLAVVTGGTSLVAKFALQAVMAFGVSNLLGNRAGSRAAGAETSGARIQLPPATNNKLPVTYGTAFLGSSITDAKISTDQKTMWFVMAVTEVPDGATITFNQIYYDNKLVTFGTNGAVASLTNNAQGSPQVDTKVANKIFIYLFPNGSSSGINTGGLTATEILSDLSIPASQRWNGPIYTYTEGSVNFSPTMSNTAFMIVKVIYDQQAGVTGLGTLTAKVTCSITKPGAAILDYMRNERYGCAIPLAQIDTASLTALDTYSDGLINYTDVNGDPATQARYRINGPLDTGIDCLTNLQNLVDACDSWLQYSEITGKWKVVINKAYNQSPGAQTINDLYSVTSSNLVGGIDVSPVDLNGTFNQLEVQYPDVNIKDQTNYAYIDLFTEYPTLISANEPVNRLVLQNQLVNNFVQAKFIGIRRLLQSREDLVIDLQLDYSGIQLEAGDVIKVTLAEYGWTNKLFRVSAVIEEKDGEDNLFARLTAFEYNATIYDDDLDITDFIPADNTGLQDPNIIGQPNAPTVVVDVENTLNTMNITGVVPTGGLTRYLDFNYGTSSNAETHEFYTTSTNSNGAPLIPNTSYSIAVNELSAGNLFWSVAARNETVGVRSNSSSVVVWPGANITIPNTISVCNASSSGTLVTSDAFTGNIVGSTVTIFSGTGILAPNTIVANVVSNTQFNLSAVPNVALANACLDITTGGINGNLIQPGTITATSLANDASRIMVEWEYIPVGNFSVINFVGAGVYVATGQFGEAVVTIDGAFAPAVQSIDNYGDFISVQNNGDPVGNVGFQVANLSANTVTVPVDVTGTANRNIPVFIPGTDPGANYYYPYLQGTSTTANYYLANSTSAFQPLDASILIVDDGNDNWYRILEANTTRPITVGETLLFDYNLQLVSDANNTVVQIGYGVRPEGQTHNLIYTPSVTTLTLNANLPVFHNVIKNKQLISGGNSDAGGVWIRNLSNGSNVSAITGELFLSAALY